MEQQRQSSPMILAQPSASGNISDLTKEELAARLVAYQSFMAKYIVESHQQKVKAVKAAEEAVAKRFEEKLKLLSGSAAPTPAAPIQVTTASKETQLYTERSAKVSAAAEAGKSRWGDMEVAKAAQAASATTVASAPVTNVGAAILGGTINGGAVVPAPRDVPVPPEVEAADHGLRADGGVGGFTLAERVFLGANIIQVNGAEGVPMVGVTNSAATRLYQNRNVKVAAAAKAGKSRWGPLELKKIQSALSSLPASSAATSQVGRGDSRVNFGAQIVGKS